MKCEKCGGLAARHSEFYGEFVRCLNCGWQSKIVFFVEIRVEERRGMYEKDELGKPLYQCPVCKRFRMRLKTAQKCKACQTAAMRGIPIAERKSRQIMA